MAIGTILFFIVVGFVVGSFLNVVIYRYNTGMTLGGRSKCFSCTKTLRWYELVPLISFLILKGRCRHCKSKLSLQYFMVELLTGVVFVLTIAKLGYFSVPQDPGLLLMLTGVALLYLLVMSILVMITVYDLRHKIIPDGLAYALGLLGIIRIGMAALLDIHYPWYVDIVSGAVLAAIFVGLWYVSHGRWMGLGDGKLVLGLSWLLPFSQNIASVLLSFWGGAIIGIILMVVSRVAHARGNKQVGMQTELPFAPFLIAAFFLTFLFDIDMSMLLTFLEFNF